MAGQYVKNIIQDDLRTTLTKELLHALRKYDLDNAISQFPNNKKKGNELEAQGTKPKSNTVSDYFKHLDKKFG